MKAEVDCGCQARLGLGTHRYKWIQHRAKERVHACQVLLALCGILIPTLKAHPVCIDPGVSCVCGPMLPECVFKAARKMCLAS